MSEETKKSSKQVSEGFTQEDLQKLIAAAVEAAVTAKAKPTEAQIKALEQAQKDRVENAEYIKQEKANEYAFQRTCSHMRQNGTCRAVYVINGNFCICQQCRAVVMPEQQKPGLEGLPYIFDTMLFNRLLQATAPSIFG